MSSNQVQEPTQLSNDNSSWLSEDIDSSSNPIEESTEIEEQKSQPSAQQKKEVKKANGKRKQAAPGQAKQAQKSRDNPQTTEESKNPQCDLSKRSFTQLRGPFILTAPHGLQIFRGQHCHQEVKLHQRERYTTQMVIRLSMELEKLMGGGSFACWNEKVATQQDKSNEDPNYMTKRQLEGSAWNQCLKNFKKKMATDAKLPTFHIDMHGKMRRKHGRIIMDLGPRQMERLWRPRDFTEKCRTAFVDEITQVFNWVNTTREVPFEIEAHPTTLTGMWINGVNHTMSHQSLLLGMPAFQMEFPPEMRAEFIQNQEFLERFAQAIVNAYKKIYDFDENGWNSLCDRVKKLSPPSESLMQSYDEFLEFVATVDKRITRF